MKATKMRNKQIYRATYRIKSNQLGSALSKDLQKKYGKRSVRVVEGDTIKVVRGEYKDVDGKVAKISTATSSIAIEGIKKEKAKGDKFDVLIHASNVVVTGLNTNDTWRIAKLEGKKPKSMPKTEKPKEVKSEKPVEKGSKEIVKVKPEKTKEVKSEKPVEKGSKEIVKAKPEKISETETKKQETDE